MTDCFNLNKVYVRDKLEDDNKALEDISLKNLEFLRKYYYPNMKAISNKNKISEKLNVIVAEYCGIIVGYSKFYYKENCICICDIGIDPNYQNKGIAKKLISQLEGLSLNYGINKLSLFTVKQTGVYHVFEKLGFNVVYKEKSNYFESYDGSRIIELYMEKAGFISITALSH